jgi:hypothetical protein
VRYLILVAIVAALGSLAFVDHRHQVDNEQYLSTIASEIAGRPVQIDCPSFFARLVAIDGESGKVEFDSAGTPADVAKLSGEACASLMKFGELLQANAFACLGGPPDSCERKIEKAVLSAHTLTHESFHLRGFPDEGVAECYAMQYDTLTLQRLGASPALAQAMAVWYQTTQYPNLPREYHSSSCRPGAAPGLR